MRTLNRLLIDLCNLLDENGLEYRYYQPDDDDHEFWVEIRPMPETRIDVIIRDEDQVMFGPAPLPYIVQSQDRLDGSVDVRIPGACSTGYDACALIRSEIERFKKKASCGQ